MLAKESSKIIIVFIQDVTIPLLLELLAVVVTVVQSCQSGNGVFAASNPIPVLPVCFHLPIVMP